MQPIDTSKLSAEIKKTESEQNKALTGNELSNNQVNSKSSSSDDINNKITAAIANKQRIAIALLLKQTLQNLSQNGLLSVDTQKAIVNAKQILPDEFTQLYIQQKVQQNKLAEILSAQTIKPEQLTAGTLRQWFSGQTIQTIVYQATQNNSASLLVDKSGYFSINVLADLSNKVISNELLKQSQLVKIKTNLPLDVGQQLLLNVNKNAFGVSFELKHPPAESNQISQFINQLIPKQQAMPQLLASLNEIATQTSQTNLFFTAQFKQQVENVFQQFPQLSQLSIAKEVKNAINNSGAFFEAKLLTAATNHYLPVTNSPTPHLTDLKSGLLQLISLIENNQAVLLPKHFSPESSIYKNFSYDSLVSSQSPLRHIIDLPAKMVHAQVQTPVLEPNLFQLNNHLLLQSRIFEQLEGVLSRIVIGQLHAREGGDQSFQNFEIPFRHNDQQEVLQLKIREQLIEKEAQKGHKIWTVNLAFHLNTLGGIRIYITLDKQDLAIQFWTENEESRRMFTNYFPLLSERLIQAGFSISQLAAFQGMPEAAQKEQSSSQFIIDEQV